MDIDNLIAERMRGRKVSFRTATPAPKARRGMRPKFSEGEMRSAWQANQDWAAGQKKEHPLGPRRVDPKAGPAKRSVFAKRTEDTFVKANVDPGLDIPEHHKLLTKFGFQYIDAMPESLEDGNEDFIHSYVHEQDGQIIVSSSGAWNMHMPHAQEESVPPGPGTWLSLETILKRNFKVTESAAILHHYYQPPTLTEPTYMQPYAPQRPTEVEQTIDQVLAGLSTHDAIHQLVHRS